MLSMNSMFRSAPLLALEGLIDACETKDAIDGPAFILTRFPLSEKRTQSKTAGFKLARTTVDFLGILREIEATQTHTIP